MSNEYYDDESVVIQAVRETAVYLNGDNDVCIAQTFDGETTFVVIPAGCIGKLIGAVQRARKNASLIAKSE
jgi:hypothetical protein